MDRNRKIDHNIVAELPKNQAGVTENATGSQKQPEEEVAKPAKNDKNGQKQSSKSR